MSGDRAPFEVTLYERPGCHLCEEATRALTPALERRGARLVHVNVEADAALEAQYGLAIPVIAIGREELARAPIDVAQVMDRVAVVMAERTRATSN